MHWQIGRHHLDLTYKSILMGILNVTPDSFSDGGLHDTRQKAVAFAKKLLNDGAVLIDIGGESTRPGSLAVEEEEEIQRVVPVIADIVRLHPEALISVDTRKPGVARAALQAGAVVINDITGFRQQEMIDVCRESDCGLVVMHMQGEPGTMQVAPHYDDVVKEISNFFLARYEELTMAGIDPSRICFDPGIGFGKTVEHNITLLRHLPELDTNGCALMMALSRKKFLSTLLGSLEKGRSPLATAVATTYAHAKGARIHRVHDVVECADALNLVNAFDGILE